MIKIFYLLVLTFFFLTVSKPDDVSITLYEKDSEQIAESFDYDGITEKVKESLYKLKEDINDYYFSIQETKNTHFEKVELLYVIDGDTLFVSTSDGTNYKVRLIGIDCPESVHEDESRNTEWGNMASNYTSALLERYVNKSIYLEYDVEMTDPYERRLAYVWLSKDTDNINNMLNARILADGYALNVEYLPNNKYSQIFSELCSDAKNNDIGLWGDYDFVNSSNK